jgi:sigma-B regulation protein RsbU (phosphoserine phosphatase)
MHRNKDVGVEQRIEVPAQAEYLHELRALAQRAAEACGFDQDGARDLVLAVNEACMNVIQHGYVGRSGNIRLEVYSLPDSVEFRIGDSANPVDLRAWRARDLDEIRPGGLGLHFIREIMDEVRYLPTPDERGNLLSLKKYRTRRGTGA